MDILGLWNTFTSIWDGVKRLLPDNLRSEVREIDARLSKMEREYGDQLSALHGDVDKLKAVVVPLYQAVYALLLEARRQNPAFEIPAEFQRLASLAGATVCALPDPDWRALALGMKNAVRLTVCGHTKEQRGFRRNKRWGCDRKVLGYHLCEKPSSDRDACLSFIRYRLAVDNEEASRILEMLRDFGWLTIYPCSAVFFHV